MKAKPLLIHVQWEGPKTWEEKNQLDGVKDYGVYQFYGCHPVYGVDTLLYIGKASKQTFAKRLKQETDWISHQDFGGLKIYVGRLSGYHGTPTTKVWEEQIDLVEKLLILAHMPAYNGPKSINRGDPRLRKLHILNWGCYRSLLPEVTGRRYSSEFDNETTYKAFEDYE